MEITHHGPTGRLAQQPVAREQQQEPVPVLTLLRNTVVETVLI